MWDSFKAEFCEIGYFCSAGEPHWQGWAVGAYVGSILLGLIFTAILIRD